MAETLEPKAESQEKVKPESNGGLTSEEIQKVVKENDPASLPPEKQKEFHERFVVGNEEIPEEKKPEDQEKPPEIKPEIPAPEIKPEIKPETEKKEGKPEPLSQDEEDNVKRLREKYYLKSNELNETKQKLQSTNKKLEEFETKNIKPPIENKETDVYSEEYIKGLETRIKTSEDRQIENEKSEETSLKSEKARLEFQSDMLEIAQLQIENVSLQTEKPFSALNAAYARFQTVIGGPENRDKFLSDPEFRKNMEAQGHIFPMSEPDWKKYKDLLDIRSFKMEKSHPDLDSAFYKWQKENGIILDPVKQASLEATEKTSQTIANSSQESIILPPNAGTVDSTSTGWTKQTVDAWIAANPNPKTKEDQKTMREINEIVQRGLI